MKKQHFTYNAYCDCKMAHGIATHFTLTQKIKFPAYSRGCNRKIIRCTDNRHNLRAPVALVTRLRNTPTVRGWFPRCGCPRTAAVHPGHSTDTASWGEPFTENTTRPPELWSDRLGQVPTSEKMQEALKAPKKNTSCGYHFDGAS